MFCGKQNPAYEARLDKFPRSLNLGNEFLEGFFFFVRSHMQNGRLKGEVITQVM
jgi:hypothetical protein